MPFNRLILNIWWLYRVGEKSSVWWNVLVLGTATFFFSYADIAPKKLQLKPNSKLKKIDGLRHKILNLKMKAALCSLALRW